MLTTVFYPSDNEFGYIKATVRRSDVSELLAMGWMMTQAEATDEAQEETESEEAEVTPPVESAKIGDGVPGSEQWHKNAIMGMEDKDAVAEYVKSVSGQDLDKRGSLDTVKDKALALVNGNGE